VVVVAFAMAAEALISNNAYMTSICIRLLLTCNQSLTQFARQSITIGGQSIVGTRRHTPRLALPAGTAPRPSRGFGARPCGLSIESAAESDQNVKRAPITGAVLFLFK
jgi:hypothetical protein